MEFRFEPPPYHATHGLQGVHCGDGQVFVKVLGDTVVFLADRRGLLDLAKDLITLAQTGIPDGFHFHYDAGGELLSGSKHLVLELASELREG